MFQQKDHLTFETIYENYDIYEQKIQQVGKVDEDGRRFASVENGKGQSKPIIVCPQILAYLH